MDAAGVGALARAVLLLERPSLAAKLAEHAGQPLNAVLAMLPHTASRPIHQAVENSLQHCLHWAIHSIGETPVRPPRWGATALVGVTGGLGGVMGWLALPVELPVTTALMLRGVAQIARHHGEDLSRADARFACLEVFAFGGARQRARTDIGYWASRAMFARLAGQVTSHVVERGVTSVTAPVASQVLAEIATRYGAVVSEKVAAGSVPLIGAIGGASINMMFMEHFQKAAEGHFIVRRLERVYGQRAVRSAYERLARRLSEAKR